MCISIPGHWTVWRRWHSVSSNSLLGHNPRGSFVFPGWAGGRGGNFIIIVFQGWKIWSIEKSLSTERVSGKPIALTTGEWFIQWIVLSNFLTAAWDQFLIFWGYLAPFQLHLKMRKSHNILMLRMCFSNWIMSAMNLEAILDQTEMRMWYVTSSQLKEHRNNNIILF